MKKGWKVERLGDVSKITYGYTEKASLKNIGPKFLRITDIQNNHVDWGNVPFCKIDKNELPKYLLKAGDIVFARTGATTGKSFLIKNPPLSVYASYLIRLQISDTSYLLPEYLILFFQTEAYWHEIQTGIAGSTQGGFNATKLAEIKIPIPPLPEQQRIVSLLDETFAALTKVHANAERNQVNAREVFESELNVIFSNPGKNWETCALDKYIKFIDYRGHTPTKTKSGMRLITAKNVKNNFLQREPEEFVDPEIYDTWMVRGFPVKGDVLFTTEAPLANVAQLDTDEKVLFAQRIITFQPQQEKIDQTFLKYLLLSQPIRRDIFSKATGATVQGIKAKLLKTVEIYFPPLAEQRAIVQRLDALAQETRRLEAVYQSKLEDVDELRKSVLAKAFGGLL